MAALSTGKLSKIIVGEKSRRFFAVIGPAVDEVRLTEPLANPGDIILSPKTWNLCTQEKLVIQHIENNKAVKVGFKPHLSDFQNLFWIHSTWIHHTNFTSFFLLVELTANVLNVETDAPFQERAQVLGGNVPSDAEQGQENPWEK